MNAHTEQTKFHSADESPLFQALATVFFNDTSCMIGINELGLDTDFHFDGTHIVSPHGYIIEWPDDETGNKVIEMYRQAPHRVFVAEFGPHGVVADHSITYK